MILRPRNFSDLVYRLGRIKPDRRKVLILVSRQPNEGGLNLAVRQHKRWADHGAVTVMIPPLWTPHGFWTRAFKGGRALSSLARTRLYSDRELIDALVKRGFSVPVLNLHGTFVEPDTSDPLKRLKAEKNYIQYVVSPDSRLKKIRGMIAIGRRGDLEVHPHELLAEMHYFSYPRYVRMEKAAQKIDETQFQFWLKGVQMTPSQEKQLHPAYLGHGSITRDALERIEQGWADNLLFFIGHLAKHGLRK